MGKEVKIQNQYIGVNNPVYIISEIGGNFQGFSTAVKLM